MKNQEYLLINKSVFFPKHGILAIGDLHIGYEQMLQEQGIILPFNQLEESIKDIKKIFEELKIKKLKIKKIVILGDLKHYFPFKKEEKFEIRDFFKFLESEIGIKEKNIILIKGNHEKIELDKRKHRDYYVKENIAFAHGDKVFPEILDKKIKFIILGHLHPAVFLTDKKGGIKKEKYKCFLIGKWKNKKTIILPSFFPLKEGTDIEEENHHRMNKQGKNFFIIPKEKLRNFNVYITSPEKIYEFGKRKKL